MKEKEKFEVGYDKNSGMETEIVDWKSKTVKKASVIHKGSDGFLTVEFEDGTNKKYGYSDLGFWEA